MGLYGADVQRQAHRKESKYGRSPQLTDSMVYKWNDIGIKNSLMKLVSNRNRYFVPDQENPC